MAAASPALLERVTALRGELFELIANAAERRDGQLSEVLLDLQRAANCLGIAERLLATDPGDESGHSPETAHVMPGPPLSQDAAIALALAATAMPFAGSELDEAERWLRILRLHGRVAEVFQRLGVPEGPLESMAQQPVPGGADSDSARIRKVEARARELAQRRNAPLLTTFDLLAGVLTVYGGAFDRALYVRGASREQLLAELNAYAAVGSR